MVLEHQLIPFLDWFRSAFIFLIVTSLLLGGAFVLGTFLLASIRRGPGEAARRLGNTLTSAVVDFRLLSFRRLFAIAKLTIKESLRKKVVVVVLVFLVVLMFASWFLDVDTDAPARLYLGFVLTLTMYTVFVVALFLSAFSLPADIKSRTIYTIVTKPVRPWEIILGRILGFTVVCSAILILMCVVNYGFVKRGLYHRHVADAEETEPIPNSPGAVQGETSFARYHRHTHKIAENGLGESDSRKGHFHYVERDEDGTISVGPPQYDSLQARIPVYGRLRFLKRNGEPSDVGINVGNEWSYRGYIEGGTLSAGIWRFEGLDRDDFANGLPLEMTIRVYRTYTGDMTRGIVGSLLLRNPRFAEGVTVAGDVDEDAAVSSTAIPIVATDMTQDSLLIPRRITAQMPDNTTREVDIFESLVHDGTLEIVIQCDERAQYYGMASPDLYIRAADAYFELNFIKNYLTVWMQLLIVITFGVMFSTFLNGAVAMLATFFCAMLGYFSRTIADIASRDIEGGGPFEALVRLVTQENVVTPLEGGAQNVAVVDTPLMYVMRALAQVMPNFHSFAEYGGMNTSDFVANGFNIPGNLVGQQSLVCLAYVMVLSCLAYIFLKTREIAA